MKLYEVRPHKSAEALPREEQLAWKLALLAADPVAVEPEVAEMVANRLIDDAGVAAAALGRRPVANARAQALHHHHA
ncbi:MAG: MmgE/PrpD family protein, partial [Acidimicrobiales bacterium]